MTLRTVSFSRFAVAVVFALLAGSVAAAQSNERLWGQLREAVSKDDINAVKNLVKANQGEAAEAFFRALDQYMQAAIQGTDAVDAEKKMMEQIANAYFVVFEDRDYERYAQYVQSLSTPHKSVWSNAWGDYLKMVELRDKVVSSKSIADLPALEEKGEAAGATFRELGDRYGIALVRQVMGYAAYFVNELDKAETHYKDAVVYAQAAGSLAIEKNAKENLASIEAERARKKAAAEKAAAAKNEKKPEKGGEESDSSWTKVPLTYKADPAGDSFKTPHPMNTDEYTLWSRMALKDKDLKNVSDIFADQAETFQSYAQSVTAIDPRKSSPLREFQLMNEKGKVFLDLNDDGKPDPDERVKASSKPDFQEFTLKLKNGKTTKYGMQIGAPGQETVFNQKVTLSQDPDKVLVYRRSCAMHGDALGEKIVLVDDNNNGTYDDYGSDGIVVGSQSDFLSKYVPIGGKLYEVRVTDPLGTEVRLREYAKDTGKIVTQWKGKVTPAYLYVRGTAGESQNAIMRLDLKSPVTVPAGEYEFYFGMIREGQGRQAKTCEIRKGKSKAFKVEKDGEVTLTLGAPFEFDYKLTAQGEKMQLRGRDLSVTGKLGEQYVRFYPAVLMPEVIVKKDGGGQVAKEKLKQIDGGTTWQEDLAWFPKDIEWDKAGKAAFKLKITGDHALLGAIKKDDK